MLVGAEGNSCTYRRLKATPEGIEPWTSGLPEFIPVVYTTRPFQGLKKLWPGHTYCMAGPYKYVWRAPTAARSFRAETRALRWGRSHIRERLAPKQASTQPVRVQREHYCHMSIASCEPCERNDRVRALIYARACALLQVCYAWVVQPAAPPRLGPGPMAGGQVPIGSKHRSSARREHRGKEYRMHVKGYAMPGLLVRRREPSFSYNDAFSTVVRRER